MVFQSPRIKEEYINDYYTNELGYYQPSQDKEKKHFFSKIKIFIYCQTLINHFDYINLGSQNAFLKIATLPFKRKVEISLVPNFVKRGNLLEIGCSYRARLEKLKKLGWKVEGIEMDKKSAEFAQKEKGLSVQNKKIEGVFFKRTALMSLS